MMRSAWDLDRQVKTKSIFVARLNIPAALA
jgi:hypothetical protein